MDPAEPLVRADVRVRGGRIVGLPRRSRSAFVRELDVRDHVVLPGFVQGHVHLCQTLFRGLGGDRPLLPWLRERVWPLEGAHRPASLRASARLGVSELVAGGTTTLLDMGTVHHQDVIFEVLQESGVRALAGKAMMDEGDGIPRGLQETTAESIRESERLLARWHGEAGGRLRYAWAPRFILSCSEELLDTVGTRARETGTHVHSHVAEQRAEREAVKTLRGKDDLAALRAHGIAGPHVVLAHGVHLRAAERRALARDGTTITHCPSANLKLASGIADIVGLRDAGVSLAIGADGAPCNDRMDPWTELRTAALLAKVKRDDATALGAFDALHLATRGGALALGLEDVGLVREGFRADLQVVSLTSLSQAPSGAGDLEGLLHRLVYAATPHDVRHVLVEGAILHEAGESTRFDSAEVAADARREAKKLVRRAGLA